MITLLASKDLAVGFMRKQGWINGKSDNQEIKVLQEEINVLKDNHLSHLEGKIDKQSVVLAEIRDYSRDSLKVLQRIEKNGK